MAVNNLLAALAEASANELSPEAIEYIESGRENFQKKFAVFFQMARNYFRDIRMTVNTEGGTRVDNPGSGVRERLFGHPMTGGGEAGALLNFIEEAVYQTHFR
ncbi:MAG: hypothetical protein K2H64_12460 [Desulfovibrio sp.]|nr:hypothetical protein [Desulfovibrio sp.]